MFRLDANNTPHFVGTINVGLSGLAYGSLGSIVNQLFVGNHESGVGGSVFVMDPLTGNTFTLATGFNSASEVVFSPSGDIFVADENTDEIWRIFAVNQAAAVPEPVTTTSLVMAGAVMLLRRRRGWHS